MPRKRAQRLFQGIKVLSARKDRVVKVNLRYLIRVIVRATVEEVEREGWVIHHKSSPTCGITEPGRV